MKNLPSIHAFIGYIRTFRGAFVLTAVMFASADVALSVVPWLVGRLAQALTTDQSQVTLWLSLVVGASVLHHLLWNCGDILYRAKLLERMQRLDDVVFNEVIHKDYSFFTDRFTGKVSSYVTLLGREMRDMLDQFMHSYLGMVVFVPLFVATMFTVNVQTGALFILSLLLMVAGGKPLARRDAKAERVEADARSTVDGETVDSIANFAAIKAYGTEAREAARLRTKRGSVVDAAKASYLRSIYFWGYMGTAVRLLLWPATFILNVVLYMRGDIGIQEISTFLTAIAIYQTYIWEVVWNFSQLNIRIARLEEAYRYLFGTRDIIAVPTPVAASRRQSHDFNRSIELSNIRFSYPDNERVAVLKGFSLTVAKGEKIGVVGPSGGGKSTLLKLLLGYYPLPHGALRIDGQPADNQSLTDLIAYVPQDTTIFHRSIRDNIAYARPEAADDEVIAAAKHAQAHDFIVTLQDGYGTLVGERGVKLSGGQRQRIAIARAILKDAPLLLLDEATSALDSESEQYIQKALWDLLQGRTAFVIAHRLSTIQKMDRIVVIDDGTIVEQGTHAELLAAKGVYAKLWTHQSGGFIED